MRTHAQSGSRYGSAEEAMRLLRGGLRRDLVITESLAAGMTGPELAWICKAHHPGSRSGYAEMEGGRPYLPRLTKLFRSVDLASSLAALCREDCENR